jgi:hypothetical protein
LKGDSAGANTLTLQALSLLQAMTQQDPGNTGWQRELAEARIELADLASVAGHDDEARAALQSALTALEPLLAQQPQDRSTVLATNTARLRMAAISEDAAAANVLREKARTSLEAQTSGLGDPRLRALRTEAAAAPTTTLRP